jgi:DNA polymerase-3 subunit alpha
MAAAKMCGVINNFEEKTSKKGNKFGVFTLVDFYGRGDCVVFGKIYEAKKELFANDTLVYIEGKAEESADKIKLIVQDIYPIEKLHQMRAENINIEFPKEGISAEKLLAIKKLTDEFPGKTKLYFTVRDNGKTKMYFAKEIKISATDELISNLKKIVGEHNLHIN